MSKKLRTFKSALGISTGDMVEWRDPFQGYHGGPYKIIEIHGPSYVDNYVSEKVIRTWPTISLVCYDPRHQNGTMNSRSYLNGIRQEGDRWFEDSNVEVFVKRQFETGEIYTLDMFAPAEPKAEPYPFVEGLDYTKYIWQCNHGCGDFNADPETNVNSLKHSRWHCIKCGRYGVTKLLLMPPRVTGKRQPCSFQFSMGYWYPKDDGELANHWSD